MTHRVQLAVEYGDHQTRYYPANRGWRIDAASRCIVIGRDLPRTYVPLDRVTGWTVERIDQADTEATPEEVQNLLDDAAVAFTNAGSQSERVEALRDLLAGWYAAWPATAVTDPHEPIAWQLASIIAAAEARASQPAADRPVPGCYRCQLGDPHQVHETAADTFGKPAGPGGVMPGEDYQHPADEMVWLGDLSGFRIIAGHGRRTELVHRCGWTHDLGDDVISYLANLLDGPVRQHRADGCTPVEG